MKKGQVNSLPGLGSGPGRKNAGGQGKAAASDVLSARSSENAGGSDRSEVAIGADPVDADGKWQETVPAADDVYRAIRLKCLECSGDSRDEVRLCDRRSCPLFAYRLGRQRVVVERSRAGDGPYQGSLLEF